MSASAPGPATSASLSTLPTWPQGSPAGDLRTLYRLAVERHSGLDSFIVRLRRREVVNGRPRPEEVLLLKYRKSPWSVYLKWLGGEGVGREALHVKGRYSDKLHVLTAAGDMPVVPAGRRLSFSPDSPLVRSNSRHPITEAGFELLLEHFGKVLDGMERGDRRLGTLKYLGVLKRPEFEDPVEAVMEAIPPGMEPDLPDGGQRFWYFDPLLRLPVLIVTLDDNRREIEYYCHDRFLFPGRLSDDEFNPDILWRR